MVQSAPSGTRVKPGSRAQKTFRQIWKALSSQKTKIEMPRSVNSVASRARRKKSDEASQRILWPQKECLDSMLKMPLKKDFYTAIQVESIRKEILERFGFSELTQVQGYMECRIANSWVKCLKAE